MCKRCSSLNMGLLVHGFIREGVCRIICCAGNVANAPPAKTSQ